jgi:hypothetical protein
MQKLAFRNLGVGCQGADDYVVAFNANAAQFGNGVEADDRLELEPGLHQVDKIHAACDETGVARGGHGLNRFIDGASAHEPEGRYVLA